MAVGNDEDRHVADLGIEPPAVLARRRGGEQGWTPPALVPGLTGVRAVACGAAQIWALKTDDTVVACNTSMGELAKGVRKPQARTTHGNRHGLVQ